MLLLLGPAGPGVPHGTYTSAEDVGGGGTGVRFILGVPGSANALTPGDTVTVNGTEYDGACVLSAVANESFETTDIAFTATDTGTWIKVV